MSELARAPVAYQTALEDYPRPKSKPQRLPVDIECVLLAELSQREAPTGPKDDQILVGIARADLGEGENEMPVAQTPLEQKLLKTLRRIAREYRSAESILRTGDAGLSGEETLEYAYDNIQQEAKNAIRGIRLPKTSGG